MDTFNIWLAKELRNRDWTQADLARAAGITRTSVSRVIGEMRGAGPEVCVAIARALDMPPETIFRAAGLLPPSRDPGEAEEELLYHYRDLDEAGQREARAVIKVLRETHANWPKK